MSSGEGIEQELNSGRSSEDPSSVKRRVHGGMESNDETISAQQSTVSRRGENRARVRREVIEIEDFEEFRRSMPLVRSISTVKVEVVGLQTLTQGQQRAAPLG